MKRLIVLLLAAGAATMLRAQTDNALLWDRANTAYVNGDYRAAIERYDSILGSGQASVKLYYNLGNACFKSGEIGRSILNYNRALRLAPSNSDIRYNLTIAQSYTKDNIEKMPEFFVLRWLRAVRTLLGSNAWAWMSLGLLALALASALLYLLSGRMSLRKTGFYGAIVLGTLFIFSAANASIERGEMFDSSHAIVLNNAVPVKSSPDEQSKDIFVLHEGTSVEIVSRLGAWCEISIANGNKGWIPASAIEVI
ncbi:hypothetical protein FACS1894159_06270 [Bacteroidia bacterium]|nr:hypothetical protein FACS1894159_06270 [Bacteroidia bacterium]